MSDKQSLLDQIKSDILERNICPNLAETATNLVMGDGNVDADIVFIGEAPGKNEDEQGLPFVGAAGKFLNEMLASVDLDRSDIFITNIVKYRPPNNRDPLPDEKKAFWPYLLRQLEVISPKIIVTLGRHSMEYFLPDAKISQIHGQPKRMKVLLHGPAGNSGADAMQGDDEQWTEVRDERSEGVAESATQQRTASDSGAVASGQGQAVATWIILPLYHPAAALYNGGMRETLLDDFRRVPAILQKI